MKRDSLVKARRIVEEKIKSLTSRGAPAVRGTHVEIITDKAAAIRPTTESEKTR